jgi:hypothetical protein
VTNWISLKVGLEREIGVTEIVGSPRLTSTLAYRIKKLSVRKTHFELS